MDGLGQGEWLVVDGQQGALVAQSYLGSLGLSLQSDGIAFRCVANAKGAEFDADDALADLLLLLDALQLDVVLGIACELARRIGLLLDEQMDADGRLGQEIDHSVSRLTRLQLDNLRLCTTLNVEH